MSTNVCVPHRCQHGLTLPCQVMFMSAYRLCYRCVWDPVIVSMVYRCGQWMDVASSLLQWSTNITLRTLLLVLGVRSACYCEDSNYNNNNNNNNNITCQYFHCICCCFNDRTVTSSSCEIAAAETAATVVEVVEVVEAVRVVVAVVVVT